MKPPEKPEYADMGYAKPVFVAYVPSEGMTHETYLRTVSHLEEKLTEYHVLVVHTKESDIRFELFNGEKMKDADIQQLRTELLNLMK